MLDRRRAATLAAAIAISLLGALPGAAAASFGIGSVSAAPADQTAGAHTPFALRLAADDPGSGLQAFVAHLPPGQIGDPTATARCSQDQFAAGACPAGTHAGALALTGGTTASGDIYLLPPALGSEVERLGIVLHAPGGDERLQAPVSLRADGGLDLTVDGLPAGVTSVTLTLNGANPTSCAAATTAIDAYSYAAPGQPAHASAWYTPQACDAVGFSPVLVVTAGGAGQTARGTHPDFSAATRQPPGQAGVRQLTVALPEGLAVDPAALGRAPFRIGSISAATPLLPSPLGGPVTVLGPAAPGAPLQLSASLAGFGAAIPLSGTLALTGTRLQATFDGIPDLALSSFALTLDPSGLLISSRDLCTGASLFADATITSQSGAQWPTGVPVSVQGCPPLRPTASARLTGVAARRPVLHVRIRAAAGDTIRDAGVGLPPALRFATRRARSPVTMLADAKLVRRPSVTLTSSAISVGNLGARARTVELLFRPGTLRLTGRLRPGSRVALRVGYVDSAMRARRLTLRVLARR